MPHDIFKVAAYHEWFLQNEAFKYPVGSIWRHYKGELYKIRAIVMCETTEEPMICYESTTSPMIYAWCRRLSEWIEPVIHEGKSIKRFTQETLEEPDSLTPKDQIKRVFGFRNLKLNDDDVALLYTKYNKDRIAFWPWLEEVLKILEKHRSLWENGLVYGYLDIKDASELLRGCPVGTFLFRFSDTKPLVLTRVPHYGACVTETYEVNEDLNPNTLMDIILGWIADGVSYFPRCSNTRTISEPSADIQ